MVKTRCEVYSRVVGYIRPVSNWNDSKQAEFYDRHRFDSAINEVKQEEKNEEIIEELQKQTKLGAKK
jgi:ribonucleoside-triphosphate reductase